MRVVTVAPCAHLLCVNCAASERERCPACGVAYIMQASPLGRGDARSRSAPCTWRARPHGQPRPPPAAPFYRPPLHAPPPLSSTPPQAVDDPERLRLNPAPKWPVPLELIEWQPAYVQRGEEGRGGCVGGVEGGRREGAKTSADRVRACTRGLCAPPLLWRAPPFNHTPARHGSAGAQGIQEGTWQADWQHTQSTKCLHLLARLREAGAAPPPGWAGCPFHVSAKTIVFTQVGAAHRWCWVLRVWGEAAGTVRRAAATALPALSQPGNLDDGAPRAPPRPPLQFWEHVSVLSNYLRRHRVGFEMHTAGMSEAERGVARRAFRHLSSCGVLLMDSSGSVGHDLSFASHVFLMEPVQDAALEEQVGDARAQLLPSTLAPAPRVCRSPPQHRSRALGHPLVARCIPAPAAHARCAHAGGEPRAPHGRGARCVR